MLLLRRSVRERIGSTGPSLELLTRLWGAAIAGAALAWAVKLALPAVHPIVQAIAVLTPYGLTYLGLTMAMRVPEASGALNRILARRK